MADNMFETYFKVDGFMFTLVSMCESTVILSILWSAAHHFANEDVIRSKRQKSRITEGIIAGLLCVLVFIVPTLVAKYAFGIDLLGENRLLFLGGYQVLMVILFTWIGFQLLFMYEDGVHHQVSATTNNMSSISTKLKDKKIFNEKAKNYSKEKSTDPNKDHIELGNMRQKTTDKSNRREETCNQTFGNNKNMVQKPEPAKVNQKTLDFNGLNQSSSAHLKHIDNLFPAEKRGLTFMHLISSWVAYFVFLESYLYIMQFSSSEVKSMILPTVCSLLIAVACGILFTLIFKKISLCKLFFIYCLIILAVSSDLVHRATERFMSYANLNFKEEAEKWTPVSIYRVSAFAALAYWVIILFCLLVHYKLIQKV